MINKEELREIIKTAEGIKYKNANEQVALCDLMGIAKLYLQGKLVEAMSEEEIKNIILNYLVDTQKERMFKNIIRSKGFGKNTVVSKSLAKALTGKVGKI